MLLCAPSLRDVKCPDSNATWYRYYFVDPRPHVFFTFLIHGGQCPNLLMSVGEIESQGRADGLAGRRSPALFEKTSTGLAWTLTRLNVFCCKHLICLF